MKSYRIQSDNEEVIKLLDGLGRKRSEVITSLLKNVIEQYDGYLPPFVMAETGCMYIPDSYTPSKKNTNKNSDRITKKSPKTNKISNEIPEKDVEVVIDNNTKNNIIEEVNTTVDDVITDITTDDGTPNITNPDLIFAGLSAFGI